MGLSARLWGLCHLVRREFGPARAEDNWTIRSELRHLTEAQWVAPHQSHRRISSHCWRTHLCRISAGITQLDPHTTHSHLHPPDEMNPKKSLKSLRLHLSQDPPSSLNISVVQQNVQHEPCLPWAGAASLHPCATWKPSHTGSSPQLSSPPSEGLGKQEISPGLVSTSSLSQTHIPRTSRNTN